MRERRANETQRRLPLESGMDVDPGQLQVPNRSFCASSAKPFNFRQAIQLPLFISMRTHTPRY
jgi:hypothetical protein